MSKFLQQRNWTLLIAAAGAVCVLLLSEALDYVTGNLRTLQVEKLPQTRKPSKPFDAQSLYPVLVTTRAKAEPADGNSEIDSLFNKEKTSVSEAPIEPDYAGMLKARLRVDGVSQDGAFINGRFYQVGDRITDFMYPSAGKTVIPVVTSVTDKHVVVTHGVHKAVIARRKD